MAVPVDGHIPLVFQGYSPLFVEMDRHIPAHIRVDPPEAGLKTPSVMLRDPQRAIRKDRLGKAA